MSHRIDERIVELVSGTRIIRTQLVEGISIPAIIHNSSYFFVNLQVFADGLVDCWEMVDFALFEQKLASGWVTTKIPDGDAISIHGLAAWKIADGSWALTPEALFARVQSLVRELNPRMENLFDCHGTTVEVIGKVRYARHGLTHERPVRFAKPELGRFSQRTEGEHASILVRAPRTRDITDATSDATNDATNDAIYLADLRVFADGTIELGRLPVPETHDLASLTAAAKAGRVLTTVPVGTRITIHELGAFTVAEEHYVTALDDMLRSVPDLVDKANRRPDSVQRCRDAFRRYEAAPSDELRDALRTAYEAVPSHNRMYVGDMDTKDGVVRRILYGNETIPGFTEADDDEFDDELDDGLDDDER